MSEGQHLKEQCLIMAATDLERLMFIIGDLTFTGYKIARCKLKGYSYNQCVRSLDISKSLAQYYWEKCQEKGYDLEIKRILNLP